MQGAAVVDIAVWMHNGLGVGHFERIESVKCFDICLRIHFEAVDDNADSMRTWDTSHLPFSTAAGLFTEVDQKILQRSIRFDFILGVNAVFQSRVSSLEVFCVLNLCRNFSDTRPDVFFSN